MKILKTAIGMFQTMGLEEKLLASFKRRYQEFLRAHGEDREALQKEFVDETGWFVGAANIAKEIQEIIDIHGEPVSTSIPKRVKFAIVSPKHPWGEHASAFFTVSDGSYVIGVTADNIWQVPFGEQLSSTLTHELQHVLKAIYEGSINVKYESSEDTDAYYSDPWEIQAYSGVVAKSSFDTIRGLYESRIESIMQENPRKAQAIADSLVRNKDMLAKSFLMPEVQRFLEKISNKEGKELPQELRTDYFRSSYRNFVTLIEDFHGRLSDLIMLYSGQLGEDEGRE